MKKHQPSKMATYIGFAATLSALLYHITVFFIFLWLGVQQMVIYNVFSVVLFASMLLMIILPKKKSLVLLFTLAMIEVIIHQILAECFLGQELKFHFIIFMTGLLPYFVFDYRLKLATPMTIICALLFVILEVIDFSNVPNFQDFLHVMHITPVVLSSSKIILFKTINIAFSIILIVITILLFSYLVAQSERRLTKQNLMLEGEIKRASIIQQAFFKQNISGVKDWNIAYFNRAMAGVSGDFFDFYTTDASFDGFGIFDVSGHGISSGLVTMLVKNIIFREFYDGKDVPLWKIMTRINERIMEEKGEVENYLTGIIVRFTPDHAEMVIAGHPAPLIFNAKSGKCDYLKKTTESTGVIGLSGLPAFYDSQFVDFAHGDRLFFFSDGVTDLLNEEKKEFGKVRLLRAFAESVDLDTQGQTDYIKEKIMQFQGATAQNDDISMICIRRA